VCVSSKKSATMNIFPTVAGKVSTAFSTFLLIKTVVVVAKRRGRTKPYIGKKH